MQVWLKECQAGKQLDGSKVGGNKDDPHAANPVVTQLLRRPSGSSSVLQVDVEVDKASLG